MALSAEQLHTIREMVGGLLRKSPLGHEITVETSCLGIRVRETPQGQIGFIAGVSHRDRKAYGQWLFDPKVRFFPEGSKLPTSALFMDGKGARVIVTFQGEMRIPKEV